jgi:regulatory protein
VGLLARKGYPAPLAYRVVREALEQEGVDTAEAGIDLDSMAEAAATVDTADSVAVITESEF